MKHQHTYKTQDSFFKNCLWINIYTKNVVYVYKNQTQITYHNCHKKISGWVYYLIHFNMKKPIFASLKLGNFFFLLSFHLWSFLQQPLCTPVGKGFHGYIQTSPWKPRSPDFGWSMAIKLRVLVEIWLLNSGFGWNMNIKLRVLVEVWLLNSGFWLKYDN
jgi:hypothetical protein